MKWFSILQDDPSLCYYGHPGPLHTHHVFGAAKRSCSTKDGLVVMLCISCHDHVHHHPKKIMNTELRQEAQRKWMQYYGKTEDDFRKRYGRSVLE